jgi:hypothetical protein
MNFVRQLLRYGLLALLAAPAFAEGLTVTAVMSQAAAAVGTRGHANMIVSVVGLNNGNPVTTLVKTDFFVSDQMSLPGQTCGFSNEVATFANIGNGIYQFTLTLPDLGQCGWVKGTYLAGIQVSASAGHGLTVSKLVIE